MGGVMLHRIGLLAQMSASGPSYPGALVRLSSGFTGSGATEVVPWDTEVYDNGGWHSISSNTSRLTVPSSVSLVRVVSSNECSSRSAIDHLKGGAVFRGMGGKSTSTGGQNIICAASALLEVSTGNYFQHEVSGIGLATADATTSSWAAIEKVDSSTKRALVNRSSNQAIAAATTTTVNWNTEVYDTDSWHTDKASTVTITIASPGVVTWNNHGFVAGSPVVFTTTGALPTGLTAGTIYYVVSPTTNTFQVSASTGGSAINTSGSQSGTHTATNSSRLVVPSGVTLIRIGGNFVGDNTGQAVLTFLKNGSGAVRGLPAYDCDVLGVDYVNAWSAPLVVSSGDYFELRAFITDGANIGTDERNWFAIEEVPSTYKRALVNKSGNQSVSDSTTTTLTFDQEVYDTDSIHDNVTNNSRLTVPSGVTQARLLFSIRTPSATGQMVANVRKNGTGTGGYGHPASETDTAGTDSISAMGAWIDVTPGDYFELRFFQSSGGSMNIGTDEETWFCMECR